jgi:octanoyl-[GcvH]:protein N-octanoyltransferase
MVKSDITGECSLLRFEQPWALKSFDEQGDLTQQVTFDELLLKQVINGESGPSLYIKRNPRCLVATVRESRMANFEAARQELSVQGWPVIVRCTGGTCVPQGPGVINLSVIHRKVRGWSLEEGYKLLCDLLTSFLASYDLVATTGEVPGSFCDGRYNLQVGGQKLVGTAQRWTGGSRENAAVLAHACLLVDMDLVEATEKINRLYRVCGNPQQFIPEACTTLRDCLGGGGRHSSEEFMEEVEQRLTALVKDYFNI